MMTSARLPSADTLARAGALLALALLPALPAAADVRMGPQVQDLVAGLFCAPDETGRRDAPDTVAGWVHVPDAPVQMVAEGRVAPAVLGMGFGVRFLREGSELTGIRYEISHPPMTAAGITRQGWDSLSQAGDWDAIFFQFDEPDELIPGEWVFAAFDGANELFSVPFTVVDAARAPELAGLCRGGAMMSMLTLPR